MVHRFLIGLLAWLVTVAPAIACPFCAAESQTLTEEMDGSSVTLLAKLAMPSEASQKVADSDVPYEFFDPETGTARFKVEEVLLGKSLMEGVEEIEAIYFGEPDTEGLYLIRGIGEPPDWAIPLPLSPLAAEYVPKLLELPEGGADRLAFFQQYLEHEDPLLSQDAYDEFARAPYQDVVDLGPRMDRQRLRDWIVDYRVSPSRRRLFLTMLGVCGEPEDLERLEELLTSDIRILGPAIEAEAELALAAGASPAVGMAAEMVRFGERQRKLGLDALIACYLTLAGKHGDASQALNLIDERYLSDPESDYSHVYAALQALRFLASEQQELVSMPRLLESARLLLDNPEFADQVIPDLARWEDWSVLNRLTEMYKSTYDDEAEDAPVKYVREPIISYLDVAATQSPEIAEQAEESLAQIEPLDTKTVQRARSLRAFGVLGQARAKREAGDAPPPIDPAIALPEGAEAGEPAEAGETSGIASEATPPNPSEPEATPPAATIAAEPPTPIATPAEVPSEAPLEAPPALPERPEATQVAEAPESSPPSQSLLIGLPLAAAAALIGVFWLVLRGGVG